MLKNNDKVLDFWSKARPAPTPPFFYLMKNKIKSFFKFPPKKPESEDYWTTLYYGARGSGKSQHQAKEIVKILKWLDWLYEKYPTEKQAIIYSVQKFNKDIENKYLGWRLFYWTNANDLRYCPRANCWRYPKKHRLHGCYLIYDDIASVYPNKPSFQLPEWKIKMFSQARKFGVRILANCQDPFSVNIDFRRYVDMAFKFSKIFSTRDPDETRPPLKFIFGLYRRRKIRADILWEIGDMSEMAILIEKEKAREKSIKYKVINTMKYLWIPSWGWINKKTCSIYDTTQEIAAYEPKGFISKTLYCIDPAHNHTDPKAENYCKYKKVYYELI